MAGLTQPSSTADLGWERDLSVLCCDCIDPDSFIAVVRASSGASADLTGAFLDRYVFDSGVLFLRLGISVEPMKADNKPRLINVVVEQVCSKEGELSKHHGVQEDIKLRIAEVRDDVTKEPTLSVGAKKEVYVQQMHTRPGRLRGKRLVKKGKSQEDMTAEEIAHQSLLEKRKEAQRDSLQISRDIDYPVR
jgi:hypothetical protein